MTEQIELGCIMHFVGADRCRWRRATIVGHYVVSTLGDYWPMGQVHEPSVVGVDRLYETMVFRLTDKTRPGSDGCPCRVIAHWNELEVAGYNTAGEAHEGHEAMVAKYLEKQ